MNKLSSLIVGIVSVVLSAGSAAAAAHYWFSAYAPKHALLFSAIFVVLLVFGILCFAGVFSAAQKAGPEKA